MRVLFPNEEAAWPTTMFGPEKKNYNNVVVYFLFFFFVLFNEKFFFFFFVEKDEFWGDFRFCAVF